MKIYSSEENKPTFTDFAGKDVWVRCCNVDYLNNDNGSDRCTGVIYVRVLGTPVDGNFMYNRLSGGTVAWALESDIKDEGVYGDLVDFVEESSGTYGNGRALAAHYVITSPLEIIDSSELFPEDVDTQRILAKIVGKDAWIKVIDLSNNEPVYIKVFSLDNGLVGYSIIFAAVLDVDDADYIDEDDIQSAFDTIARDYIEGYAPCSTWKLCIPVETFSTEEITDILLRNFGASYIDNEYDGEDEE